ncbi:hypothetical protein Vretimale_9871 [Volvox reticuliferus]|uniref:Uncharacterized protein n=1 Tax=Volvox reticuliferus TaxID=1737510 RepID=A0A8J4LQS2_9CHLO|nr:hypothetical protein Vretifemale_13657 [Volvox reticuliferus]GIM05397.1 hypothetical protein Vretimale_9871 [Volvox reticuliferus]
MPCTDIVTMSSDKEEHVASRSEPLELDIGPPLSSRQRKAAATFTLAQLLALADLRATARLKEPSARRSRTNGVLAGCRSAATRAAAEGPMAVMRLRQSAAKRRAEEEADAASGTSPLPRHRTGFSSAAPAAVGGKRIAIVPPLSTPPKGTVPVEHLGCHLARRWGPGSGGVRSSSLARVYGSRLRVGWLPEDYAECFIGLEPVRQPDDVDGEDSSAHVVRRRTAAAAGVAGVVEGSGLSAAAPPPTGGALLGSAGVGEEMSFLFAANNGMASVAATASLAPGVPAMAAAVGGLMAPFASVAANPSQPAPGLLYGAPLYGTTPGSGADVRGMFGGAVVAPPPMAAAAAAAPDLMLDAEDGSSSEDDEDGGAGCSGQDMGADTALGAAFDDEFEDVGPVTQHSSAGGMDGYLSGFGGGPVGGMFPYVTGGGTAVFGGTTVGLTGMCGGDGGGGGGGGGFGTGTGPNAAEDDGIMVEEF